MDIVAEVNGQNRTEMHKLHLLIEQTHAGLQTVYTAPTLSVSWLVGKPQSNGSIKIPANVFMTDLIVSCLSHGVL